jgi:hypothetical protein
MPDERDPQHLADEARKLIAMAQDWAKRTIPEHTGPECQWCPLCQLAAALRGEYPELTERVAEAGAAIANAVRALAESAAAAAPGQRPKPGTSAVPPPADPPARRPRVQRIRLDDDGPVNGSENGSGSR